MRVSEALPFCQKAVRLNSDLHQSHQSIERADLSGPFEGAAVGFLAAYHRPPAVPVSPSAVGGVITKGDSTRKRASQIDGEARASRRRREEKEKEKKKTQTLG